MTAAEQLRGQLQTRRKAPAAPAWRPPQLADFYHRMKVLAWDATLSHCAWARLEATEEEILVHAKGTIHPHTQRTSFLGTWDKAYELQSEVGKVLLDVGYGAHRVVEAPLAAGTGSRSESSLIAGLLVWMDDPKKCTVVSATHVAAVLLGDHKIKSAERKKAIRAAVIRLAPQAAGRNWNEHERDALATGLTHLYDERRLRPQRPYRIGAI